MNQINQIEIYRTASGWSFDDPSVGLVAEPFVCGIPEIIDVFSGKADRVTATFSKEWFPSYEFILYLKREENGGGWYLAEVIDKEGWLCPAVLRYFETLPETIYVRIQPLTK